MEALIKQFLASSPPSQDEGFGLSDPERNEFYHSSRDKEGFLKHLQMAETTFDDSFLINPGLTGICRFENGTAFGQDQSFHAVAWPNERLFPENTKDYYCQGLGHGAILHDDAFPWFPYSSESIRESHEGHETCGYLFCNGYGIGREDSTVDGDCIEEMTIHCFNDDYSIESIRPLDIWDIQASGGSNKGINRFNGEQLYHIDDVITGYETDCYGAHPIQNNISVLFNHVRGDIAMVRIVDLDFTTSKGYLVKSLNSEHQTCYFFGKTLHEAINNLNVITSEI